MSTDPTLRSSDYVEDDVIDWDDDLETEAGPSNSGDPQADTHSIQGAGTDEMDTSGAGVAPEVEPVGTGADDEKMKDESENAAAQAGTAGSEAGDQTIDELSSNLNRVLNPEADRQVASFQPAAALYFSRAMENIAQSKANAGVLPNSSNRFDALRRPVHASRALNFEQVSQLADQLLTQPSKRLRSSSADSSRPNKSARTEPEDANMDEVAPEEPFNFREIVDPKSSSKCYIRVNDGAWFGAAHGQIPNYQVNVHILGGRMGVPSIKLCFSIFKEEFFNQPLDKGKATGAYHELFCIWQPGLILDPNNPQYQITDLEISHPLDRNPKVAMPESLATTKSDLMTKVIGISFGSQNVTLEGAKRESVSHMDSDLLETLDQVRLEPYKVTVWYVPPPGGVQNHVQNTLKHFQIALERHLPPLHQYLTPPTWELNAKLNLAPILYFQGGMYCKNPKVNKVEDVDQIPQSFHTFQPKLHFQSELEFEIYYSVGVIREYQWQRGRIAHMSSRPHKIFLLKTYRDPTVRPQSQLKLTKAQSKFRNSYYGYVRMTPNEQGLVESVPPEGTIFTLDWANKQGGNGTHLISPKEEQWFGRVCGAKADTLTQLGAHFCLILTKPSNARGQKAFDNPSGVREKLPKAYLRPLFNDTPAEREVTAVRDFCNTSRDDLGLLRLSAVADPHHGIAEYTDLSGGPGGQEENRVRYLARLAEKRKMFNEGQMKVMESVASVVNKMMLVQGPPGSGKTTTVSHLVDLLTEVGHKILLTCASNAAVDENARKLWEVLPKDKKVLRLEIIIIDRDNTLEGKEGDYVLPDAPLPSRRSHAHDWEQDPIYLAMLAQLMTAEIIIGHESADVDRFVNGSEALKKDYAAMYERNEKRHDFPRGMSTAFRIWEMVQADIQASRDFEFEDAGINRAIARSQGTLQTPHDPSLRYRQLIERYNRLEELMTRDELNELRYEYKGQVARIIRDADVILTTCNNSGNDIIRDTFKPSVLIVDEAAQATLPTTLVPMTAYSDWMAAILVGDQAQLQPTVTSRDANEFEANLKISFFTHMIQKGYKSFLLNIQYRMSPKISQFPSLYFYNKELLDAESVKQDNPIRQKVRNVSFRDYGIKGGRTGKGSEYWMIDVARGVSRREDNGTSIQNYANASVIINLMRKLVQEGVPKAVIQVLSFYKGQIKTILKMANDVPELDDLGGVSTVDVFQGQEARVVILDLVVAHQRTANQIEALDDVYNVTTQHVRNPNRLCVGLTRARDGLIVIANTTAMGRGNKGSEGYRTLASLLVNAKERGLLHIDHMTRDTHPAAIARAEQDLEYRKQVAAEMNLIDHLAFIHDIVRNKHQLAKKSLPMTNQRPISYRLGTEAPTTLPHVDKALQAKMRTPGTNEPTPPWVDKNKPHVDYDKNVRWEQSRQRSGPRASQGPSGDQSPEKVRQEKGKQRMQSPDNTGFTEQSQSPEEVRDNKGKQPMQSPEKVESMEEDRPSEYGSEDGQGEEESTTNDTDEAIQTPPSNVAPPKQQGQRLNPIPDPEWRRGAGSGNVRGWGWRGGWRQGARGGSRGEGRGGGTGGGRGGRGGNPRGGQGFVGRAQESSVL